MKLLFLFKISLLRVEFSGKSLGLLSVGAKQLREMGVAPINDL